MAQEGFPTVPKKIEMLQPKDSKAEGHPPCSDCGLVPSYGTTFTYALVIDSPDERPILRLCHFCAYELLASLIQQRNLP